MKKLNLICIVFSLFLILSTSCDPTALSELLGDDPYNDTSQEEGGDSPTVSMGSLSQHVIEGEPPEFFTSHEEAINLAMVTIDVVYDTILDNLETTIITFDAIEKSISTEFDFETHRIEYADLEDYTQDAFEGNFSYLKLKGSYTASINDSHNFITEELKDIEFTIFDEFDNDIETFKLDSLVLETNVNTEGEDAEFIILFPDSDGLDSFIVNERVYTQADVFSCYDRLNAMIYEKDPPDGFSSNKEAIALGIIAHYILYDIEHNSYSGDTANITKTTSANKDTFTYTNYLLDNKYKELFDYVFNDNTLSNIKLKGDHSTEDGENQFTEITDITIICDSEEYEIGIEVNSSGIDDDFIRYEINDRNYSTKLVTKYINFVLADLIGFAILDSIMESPEDNIPLGFYTFILALDITEHYGENFDSSILTDGLERNIEISDSDSDGNPILYEYKYTFYEFDSLSEFLDPSRLPFANNPVEINGTYTEIERELNGSFRFTEKQLVDIEIINDADITHKVEVILKYNCDNDYNVTFAGFEKFVINDKSYTNAQANKILFE